MSNVLLDNFDDLRTLVESKVSPDHIHTVMCKQGFKGSVDDLFHWIDTNMSLNRSGEGSVGGRKIRKKNRLYKNVRTEYCPATGAERIIIDSQYVKNSELNAVDPLRTSDNGLEPPINLPRYGYVKTAHLTKYLRQYDHTLVSFVEYLEDNGFITEQLDGRSRYVTDLGSKYIKQYGSDEPIKAGNTEYCVDVVKMYMEAYDVIA